MKLATSTGDFSWYVDSIAEKIRSFRGSKFKHINLEQTGSIPEFFEESDYGWKRLANEWGEAAVYSDVNFAVSHAPCLHKPCLNALKDRSDTAYQANIRAIRRSIEICHILGIDRIVVHACPSSAFDTDTFYRYNKMFYSEFFDLTEQYNITVMTENWDHSKTHFSTGREMRDFLEEMNHPLLAACWDTAHGNIDPVARGLGQYQNIIALGDRLKGLHISDNFGDVHHHSWPFAGVVNFDSVIQGLLDVSYDGFFTFEASYTLLHQNNLPYHREPWEYKGEEVTTLLNPSVELKKKAVDLLYETGKYMLESYHCFEE